MILACDCGQTHEVRGPVADMLAMVSPRVVVTVEVRSWLVPRVWIAVHGLKARELAELARRHGWEETTQS